MVSFNNEKELWKCVSLANFVLSSTARMLLSIGFPVGSLRDDYPACFLSNRARLIAAMAPLSMPPQFAVLPCTPLSKKWDLFPHFLNLCWSCDLLRPMEGNWSAPCACSELRPQEAFQASNHHCGRPPGIALWTVQASLLESESHAILDHFPYTPLPEDTAIPPADIRVGPHKTTQPLMGAWTDPICTVWNWPRLV